MSESILFDPLLPPVIILAGGALLLVAILFWNGVLSSKFWRGLSVVVLCAWLLNPLFVERTMRNLANQNLVVVDRSASNSLRDRTERTDSLLESLRRQLDLLGQEARIVETQGSADSALVDRMKKTLESFDNTRLGAIFLVTDGQISDAQALNGLVTPDAPVHVLLTGRDDDADLSIHLVENEQYGVVKSHAEATFMVESFGYGDDPLPVRISVNGELRETRDVTPGESFTTSVFVDKPGDYAVEAALPSMDGELSDHNNIAVATFQGIRDRLRVLLISSRPHRGSRVLRRMLIDDPFVDLVHFTILRNASNYDVATNDELALIPFPQDELFVQKIQEFDLIVFDRYDDYTFFTPLHVESMASYVQKGGALLVMAGPEFVSRHRFTSSFRALMPLLPAREMSGPFVPSLTDLGNRHPVTAPLREAPAAGEWLRYVEGTVLSGQTLMKTGNGGHPLLMLDERGDGRLALLTSDHFWLWGRGFRGGGPYQTLFRNLAHWLMKEPGLEASRLAAEIRDEVLHVTRYDIQDNVGDFVVEKADGETVRLSPVETAPGVFEASLALQRPGSYRVRSDALFAWAVFSAQDLREYRHVMATGNLLAPLREQSGGGLFERPESRLPKAPLLRLVQTGRNAYDASAGWAGIFDRHAQLLVDARQRPLFPIGVWAFLLLLCLFAAFACEAGLGRLFRPRP